MPISNGGGGGGTPSAGAAPFTITETNGTSKGLVVNTQGGLGVNALEIDAPHTTLTVDGDGLVTLSSDDTLGVTFQGTGSTAADLIVKSDATDSAQCVVESDLGMYVQQRGAGTAVMIIQAQGGATLFNAGTQTSGGILTSPPAPATATLSSGVGAQLSTARDVHSYTPVTFNPTAGAAATCAVAISKDGTNYTALWTETEPAGIAFDGTVHGINVYVPAAWKLRLTVVNATIGTTTYY